MPAEIDRQRSLAELCEHLGLSFKNPGLLDQALIHSSYANENPSSGLLDNQRLEYLGDAVLGFLVAEWLFEQYPEAQEGELTGMRIQVVRSESLAAVGRDLELGRYLRMGHGEESSGGRHREANLCAAVEALVGAIYLDRGLDTTRAIVHQLLVHAAPDIEDQRTLKNAKSYLQEYTQSALQVTPTYVIVAEGGPGHERRFSAQVLVAGQVWGEGAGRSKQASEQAAARAAIEQRAL